MNDFPKVFSRNTNSQCKHTMLFVNLRFIVSRVIWAQTLLFFGSLSFSHEPLPILDARAAKTIVSACEELAKSHDIGVAIAVVDQGGNLLAFLKMNNVVPGAAKIARWKASTSALYGLPTKSFQDMAEKEQYIYSIPDLAPIEGGEPIALFKGVVLGGVGVSGAVSKLDAACARVGIEAAFPPEMAP